MATTDSTPGPGLDVKVAEALGQTFRPETNIANLPRHSTDLNAAFEAAEKFGLFSKYGCVLGMAHRASTPTWCIVAEIRRTPEYPADGWDSDNAAYLPNGFEGDAIATAATPALAICAAILALAEQGGN